MFPEKFGLESESGVETSARARLTGKPAFVSRRRRNTSVIFVLRACKSTVTAPKHSGSRACE
jgi:hypothetical protein